MNIISTNVIYLITNIFRTYVLFRFLNVFLKRNTKIRIGAEIFLYSSYYLINSAISLAFLNPFINLASNLILFYLLTIIYEGKIFTRIVSVVVMYSSSMMFETIVYNLSVYFNLSFNLEDFTIIVSNLLLFILTLLFERRIGEKRVINVNGIYLFMIFCIPLGSIAVVATLFLTNIDSTSTIIIVGILFFINIINFYLYDIIIRYCNDKYENDLLKQQNNAYLNQLEIIKESQKNIKMLKHDMKNHVISIQNMIKSENNDELNDYLQKMLDNVSNRKEYINSGNTEIDSLLNYKINEAAELCSKLDIDVNIPNNINVELFDLVIILGNLLDNSIEAIKKVSEKYLYIEMKLEKSMLFITIKNTFNGIINKSNKRILTTKNDLNNHGLGLLNIENTINKYNGSLDIEYDENMFSVDIVLYVNKNDDSQIEYV